MTAAVGLRERKKARTREALKDAAMDLFTRQGFDGTTVEEIADACEVSPRTFFRYFPTKEDVLFADTEARRERLLECLADQPAGDSAFVALSCRDAGAGARLPRRPRRARRPVEDRPGLAPTPGLQGGAAARLGSRGRRGARASSGSAGAPAAREDLQLLTAVTTAAMRVSLDAWVADAAGPDLDVRLDDAFARLASGFGSNRPG